MCGSHNSTSLPFVTRWRIGSMRVHFLDFLCGPASTLADVWMSSLENKSEREVTHLLCPIASRDAEDLVFYVNVVEAPGSGTYFCGCQGHLFWWREPGLMPCAWNQQLGLPFPYSPAFWSFLSFLTMAQAIATLVDNHSWRIRLEPVSPDFLTILLTSSSLY